MQLAYSKSRPSQSVEPQPVPLVHPCQLCRKNLQYCDKYVHICMHIHLYTYILVAIQPFSKVAIQPISQVAIQPFSKVAIQIFSRWLSSHF